MEFAGIDLSFMTPSRRSKGHRAGTDQPVGIIIAAIP